MKKPVLILSHLLFWIFSTASAPYVFMVMFLTLTRAIQHPDPEGPYKSYHYEIDYPALLIFAAIGACIFYASYFSLNFFVKRPLRFIWIVLFYTVCTLVISLPADFLSRQAATMLGPVLYFNVSGFLFRTCVEWFKDRKIKAELEKDTVASQLELLKSKINPHFLFNTLNNIDVFIQDDPKMASDYLRKLSDILRFMLYESNAEKIPLTKELEYIRKYIDLQKIRTANEKFVSLEISGDTDEKYISPMLLIHFIENAFKYATNKKIENAIVIHFKIAENHLSFFCKNHIYETKEIRAEKNGLGIYLLKQKLELLYKNVYTLTVKEENNWYLVNLEISLS